MSLPAIANDNDSNQITTQSLPPLKGKRRLWLRNYLDINNPKTFMNAAQSAKYSNYQGKDDNSFKVIGSHNVNFCYPHIQKWLDEYGLSDNRLKLKLVGLTEAKETKFFQKDGIVTDTREVEALGIQQKSLDMAFKIKGLYQDSGQGNVPTFNINFVNACGGQVPSAAISRDLPGPGVPGRDIIDLSDDDFSDILADPVDSDDDEDFSDI